MMDLKQRKPASSGKHEAEPTKQSKSTTNKEGISEGILWKYLKYTSLLCVGLSLVFLSSPLDAENLEWIKDVPLEGKFAVEHQITADKSMAMGGAECVAEDDDRNIYTGLHNGNIIKIHPHHLTGRIGEGEQEIFFKSHFPSAPKADQEATHGRPLGLRIRKNKLYVMDAIYGIYTVDLQTREATFLLQIDDVTPHLMIPDDMDITADGKTIYFTDASSRFAIGRAIYTFLEGKCTGRLFRYDVATKRAEIIKSEMCFSNGVQLNEDETVLVVAETLARRVNYFRLPDFQLLNQIYLPTMPDNVRRSGKNNFWIASCGILDDKTKFLDSHPILRRLVAGIIPYSVLHRATEVKHSLLIKTDDLGNILKTYHDADNANVFATAHASDLSDGRVALGTFMGQQLVITKLED